MKTICIINLKGGVGKTITAVNMAVMLADRGYRVLLTDADPQHNSSDFFGVTDDNNGTILALMEGYADYWPDFVTRTGIEGLDIIPSEISLIEKDIAAIMGCTCDTGVLRGFCETLEEDNAYDFHIIDCPPSFTAASVAAVLASDEIIIPVLIDAFAFSGLRELTAQIRGLQKIRPDIKIAGALITMWHNADVVVQGEALLRSAGIPVFDTIIRRTDKIGESTFAQQAIHRYSKTSSASRDYKAFLDEYLGGEKRGL